MRLLARALAVVLALLPAAAHSQATLEAAPGVRVSTTYEYYDVQGATEREIRARLKRSGPEGHDAFTRWHIRWSYPHAVAGGRCAPGPVTVDVRITFIFPRWTPPAAASDDLRRQWATVLAGLERHEDGHRDIALRAAREIQETLRALPPRASCAEVNRAATAAGQAILERSRREHERYDEVTKHGLTQGARWR